MRALKIILWIILAIIVLLLIIGLFLPKNVQVESSKTINAPAKVIFNQVNTLQNWSNWSPFLQEFPDMIQTYDGPEQGVGAVYMWKMVSDSGKLTIMESVPFVKIVNDLDFYANGKAVGSWTFQEKEDGTQVTWKIELNELSYPVEVYMGALINLSMKPSMALGLSNLKDYCENLPEETYEVVITETQVEPQYALAIKDSADMYKIGDKMDELYTELVNYFNESGIEMAGPPYASFHNWDTANLIVFEAGFPVAKEVDGKGRIYFTETYGGNVVTTYHYGAYETSDVTYMKIDEYINENGKVIIGPPWEVYLTDPTAEPDTSKWVTQIFFPIE